MENLQRVPMDDKIRELVKKARGNFAVHNLMSNPPQHRESIELWDENIVRLVKLVVEETLEQVDERTAPRGETSWYEEDKDWIRLHFGYGYFAEIKND